MDETLLVTVRDRVATLTLNRPRVRNALNSTLIVALAEQMAAVDADDEVDVIVLTGAGPAFCAGLDLRELGDTGNNLGDVPVSGWASPWAPTTKPVLAAINGPAITGGLEIALHTDLRLAAESAVFADTHARVGVVPAWGMSVLLPEAIGRQRAQWLSLTGAFLGATEALQAGLVLEVVPAEELMPRSLALAAEIVAGDQTAVRTILANHRAAALVARTPGLQIEADASAEFRRGRFDPATVAQRREAVQQLGSQQRQRAR